MTGADDALFVDTNVFVYARIMETEAHPIALLRLNELFRSGRELWTSRQVLREYLSVITKRNYFRLPLSSTQAVTAVEEITQQFKLADETPGASGQLLGLLQRFNIAGRQIHDGNIVATMLSYGIKNLLTDNTRNFSLYANLINIEPLR